MATLVHSPSARAVSFTIRGASIHAELIVPAQATGLVILAFPSGNTRANPKHQRLTGVLNDACLATLFCDLLADEESLLADITGEFRNDVPLLSNRIAAVVDWVAAQPELQDLSIGLLGVGGAAASVFVAAANRPLAVRALLARGGRLDLAWTSLCRVNVPVLLVAGENDHAMREAYAMCLPVIGSRIKEIALIPRAGVLFTDPVVLDEYAERAAKWFTECLGFAERVSGWNSELC